MLLIISPLDTLQLKSGAASIVYIKEHQCLSMRAAKIVFVTDFNYTFHTSLDCDM